MNEPLILTQGDKQSQLWMKLVKYFNEKLIDLRTMNDGLKNESETAMLRGRIAEVKSFLALAEEPLNVSKPSHDEQF